MLPRGGGVVERARGLLYADGDGDVAGEEGSAPPRGGPNSARIFSSSEDGVISTSLSKAERKVGASSFCGLAWRRGILELVSFCGGKLVCMVGALDEDASLWVGTRLVRGRLSLRSGCAGGSTGEAVVERDFRLRWFELGRFGVAASIAFSSAPQARISSGVS